MGAKQDAQELIQSTQKEMVQKSRVRPIRSYDVRKDGGSLTSTISPPARDMLGIDAETELQQFVSIEPDAIILIPENND